MMEIDSRVEVGQLWKEGDVSNPTSLNALPNLYWLTDFHEFLQKLQVLLCTSKPEYKIISRKGSVVIKTIDYLLQSIGLVLKLGLNILHSSDHFNKRIMQIDSGLEAG